MNTCNIKFQSQYAYIDNKIIHIDDILNNDYYQNIKDKLKCSNGHQLIFANGIKNKKHFRHKNNEDLNSNSMSEWHAEWQGNFPNTEKEYNKINDKQIKNRRADVVLDNSNYNIEF